MSVITRMEPRVRAGLALAEVVQAACGSGCGEGASGAAPSTAGLHGHGMA